MSDTQAPPREALKLVTTPPVTYRLGDSCFGVQRCWPEDDPDEAVTQLILYDDQTRHQHVITYAKGDVRAVSVGPFPQGAYFALLTQTPDQRYQAIVLCEKNGVVKQRLVEFDLDVTERSDLVVEYRPECDTLFITSYHLAGTLTTFPNYFLETPA